ncbi:MAG: GrpB family protein [Aigarchaeota archaeon]|nr:GrpB family protein [Candidatus Pelearchaeum maunauluense]
MDRRIKLVDYNALWPEMYREEKRRIMEKVGHLIVDVEHIGSTAIPGMKAKPIIDIMIAVKDLNIADECITLLQELGYEYVPEPDFPERCFMRKGSPENRTHHISIVKHMGHSG